MFIPPSLLIVVIVPVIAFKFVNVALPPTICACVIFAWPIFDVAESNVVIFADDKAAVPATIVAFSIVALFANKF